MANTQIGIPIVLCSMQLICEEVSLTLCQVLETGIALHSVLIGIALGVSNSPCTIRPLLAAIALHQFFEGIALGSCLIQASPPWPIVMALSDSLCIC